MLALLIEGERLKGLMQEENLETLMQDLPAWKAAVEARLQVLDLATLTPEERAAGAQLQALTQALQSALGQLSQQMTQAMSALGKQHHGANQYMRHSVESET